MTLLVTIIVWVTVPNVTFANYYVRCISTITFGRNVIVEIYEHVIFECCRCNKENAYPFVTVKMKTGANLMGFM